MRIELFNKISTNHRVDKVQGVIYGVSVITKGDAIGHDLVIDDKTLQQVKQLGSEFSSGLKVRANHPKSGEDAQIQSIIGSLKHFRIDGDKVKADLHLLKSDENYDKFLELAEEQPENFGLSIVFTGKHEQDDDVALARCTEIYACDLVDDPAANPTGLFSKSTKTMSKTIKYKKGNDGEHADDCMCASCSADSKMAAIYEALDLDENCTPEELAAKMRTIGLKSKLAEDDEPDDRRKNKKGKNKSSNNLDPDKTGENEKDEPEDHKKMSAITDQLAAFTSELEELRAERKQGIALSQKAEIETLLASAAAEGKIVPFEKDDLYTEKDGVVTIKMQPSALSKVISKLQKDGVKTPATKKVEPLKGANNRRLTGLGKGSRHFAAYGWTQETRSEVKDVLSQKHDENAQHFGSLMKKQQTTAFSANNN